MLDFSGKTVLITGACGLLGQEFTRALLECKANVILCDINKENGLKLQNDFNLAFDHRALFFPMNINSESDVQDLILYCKSHNQSIDILVNNAYPRNKKYGTDFGHIAFQDWKIPLYSWIVIYITGKVIDMTIQGVSYDKTLFIVSDKYEEIREKIINDLERGGTMINAVGMYKGHDKKLIFTNVSRREVHILRDYIESIDPDAFITVIDANEILGNGFKSLQKEH